jgi:DNA-binding NarL/FixJ family response regulator
MTPGEGESMRNGVAVDRRTADPASIATSTNIQVMGSETPTEEQVRIGLGQFNAVIARGLIHILSENEMLSVTGADLETRVLENLVEQKSLQVILLDETNIVEQVTLKRLRATDPEVGLIVLSNNVTSAYTTRLLIAGANACLPKDFSKEELFSTILLAAAGKYVIPSAGPRDAVGVHVREVPSLTPREREVFALARLGYSTAVMARDLYVSIETVRTHMAHIYRKLGIKSRRELHSIHLHLHEDESRQ